MKLKNVKNLAIAAGLLGISLSSFSGCATGYTQGPHIDDEGVIFFEWSNKPLSNSNSDLFNPSYPYDTFNPDKEMRELQEQLDRIQNPPSSRYFY